VNTLRILYQLAYADFSERVRRYSFLIVLGLTILAGYAFVPSSDAHYVAGALLHDTEGLYCFRGVYNSAWVGTNVALTSLIFLSLVGFYLVKNTIERDQRTGVGQVIAATPLSKFLYIMGKWLSNLSVLIVMIATLAVAALVMQLIRGEELPIKLWALFSPFLMIDLPAMALVAALAITFETISWLCGGLGNVVYFFLWIGIVPAGIIGDLSGVNLVEPSVATAARVAFPGWRIHEIASFGLNQVSGTLQTFRWGGIQWTGKIIAGRLLWVCAALGVAMIAALFFGRFDPAREKQKTTDHKTRPPVAKKAPVASGSLPFRLKPMIPVLMKFRFGQMLQAELNMMLKGQPWWWFLIALVLIVASLFSPLEVSRQFLLPAAWIWPLLIWSAIGVREVRHHMEQLIFSAAHPLRRQLPATWLAGVIVALITGSGMGMRLVIAGAWVNLLAWMVGALFIPSLALALGCWSGSSKLFEVVYTALWYVGPMNQVSALDFMGVTGESVTSGMPLVYLTCTVVLLGLAVLDRRRRLQD
jgi:hypothetical protein